MGTKVICKNHGIIQEIQDGVMWIGTPPTPMLFCPRCGEKTVIETTQPINTGAFYRTPTPEELEAAKQREIDYYRKKYWGGENDGKTKA